jgi:hypothetical protein
LRSDGGWPCRSIFAAQREPWAAIFCADCAGGQWLLSLIFDLPLRMTRRSYSLGKRKSARRGYVQRHQIADYDGSQAPKSKDFYWVTTQNISTGGICFLSPQKPRTAFTVVILKPGGACLLGRVAWAFCRTDLSERPFEVGCEFIARLA